MSIETRERLKHILDETKYLANLSKRLKDPDDLASNEDLKRSAERSIEIIGEAVKTLPENIRKRSPNTEWKEIARMRDNLIHRYHNIDYSIVWQVIKKSAPLLNKEVTQIFNQLNKEEYDLYRGKIEIKEVDDSSYFLKIERQKKIDITIAKKILKEYPTKFRKVALARIKDVISAGERATELKDNTETTTPTQYISEIIAALPSEKTKDSPEQNR